MYALLDVLIDRFKKINYSLLILSMIALAIMCFLDFMSVVTVRGFGFRLLPEHKGFIEQLLTIVIYIPAAYVLLGPGHLKITMISDRCRGFFRPLVDFASALSAFVIGGFLTWMAILGMLNSAKIHSLMQGELSVPLLPFFIVIVLSLVFFCIAALLLLLREAFRLRNNLSSDINVTHE